MAVRARLTPPRAEKTDWNWHKVKSTSLKASLVFRGARRMEAENYLASGYGTRISIEAKERGWARLHTVANISQPPRLKGTVVSQDFGKPYLSATQVFDVRPFSRRFLSLGKIKEPKALEVDGGEILVTRSGSVGRATLAHSVHVGHIISDDLLRIDAIDSTWWGWVYAYLRAPTVREMMKAAQYGHIIKHLETHHLDALPILHMGPQQLNAFNTGAKSVLAKRDRAYDLMLEAEDLFLKAFGEFLPDDTGETGFSARASEVFGTARRRLYFLDSSDLFEINPDITKRIADKDFGDPYDGRVRQGWVLLSRSGQIYGLNGSAMIAGHCHEGKVISDHIIRIAPNEPKCRTGYLLMAMTHPTLGRPRVKCLPYGSSIPEIEVFDAQGFQIPRLEPLMEAEIADRVEEAARLRDEADEIETQLGEDADAAIGEFLAHKSAGA